MGAARPASRRRGRVRSFHRRSFPARHGIPTLAAREGSKGVHNEAGRARKQFGPELTLGIAAYSILKLPHRECAHENKTNSEQSCRVIEPPLSSEPGGSCLPEPMSKLRS